MIRIRMDVFTIKSSARKALMAADPHYHSWPTEQQERFRATMSETIHNRVDAMLLKEILDIQCTAEKAGEIWRDLPLSTLNNLNWAKLLTTGIGDGMIWLNESMAEGKYLIDFETLYDYDYDDHLFQEQANKSQFEDYPGRDYYALRFSRWARLIIGDRFYYATLYSLADYITDTLEDQGFDMIQALIPHEYTEGKEHGKSDKGGTLWDLQVDANGLEKQLDELNSRWYEYTQERWLEISKSSVHAEPAVCTVDNNENNELHRNFIFNNENALKQIRWRYFLADCEAIKANFSEVAELEKQELSDAKSWLQASYQDIIHNFDPDVVKLKKKRKVVIASGAFDGIRRDDE